MRSHLLLIILTFVYIAVVHAAMECPHMQSLYCRCQIKYTNVYYIYCEDMGHVAQIPGFSSSPTLFEQLTMRYDTSVQMVQDRAFFGLAIKILRLQKLGIERIGEYAFQGLGEQLKELHLDGNNIYTLPTKVFIELTELEYIGLNSNLLAKIEPQTFMSQVNIMTLNLFDNVLENLNPDIFLNNKELSTLRLGHNNLTHVASHTFNKLLFLYELDLDHNRLTHVPTALFEGLVDLTHLDLSFNLIEIIAENTLKSLSSLKTLNLKNNRLSALLNDTLKYNTNLKLIDLSNNNLSKMASITFKGLNKLRTLHLSNNSIAHLDAQSFKWLNATQKLYLGYNKLSDITPAAFSGLAQLNELSLQHNRISTIHEGGFEDLSNLRYLDVSSNNLKNIDQDAFKDLNNLYNLDLSHNQLTLLGIWTKHLRGLSNLFVSWNRLSEIQEGSLTSLTHLELLELNDNNISEWPRKLFASNTKLRTLTLKNNNIKRITSGQFEGLNKLYYLYLQGNGMEFTENGSFVGIQNLFRLNLRDNLIAHFEPNAFRGLYGLRELDLSYNSISTLTDNMFQGAELRKLTLLDMSYNGISNVVPLPFRGLPNILHLILQWNRIENINVQVVKLMPTLVSFDISNNPLHCGCQLEWLRTYNNLTNIEMTFCSTPDVTQMYHAVCFPNVHCVNASMPTNETRDFCFDQLDTSDVTTTQTISVSTHNRVTERKATPDNPESTTTGFSDKDATSGPRDPVSTPHTLSSSGMTTQQVNLSEKELTSVNEGTTNGISIDNKSTYKITTTEENKSEGLYPETTNSFTTSPSRVGELTTHDEKTTNVKSDITMASSSTTGDEVTHISKYEYFVTSIDGRITDQEPNTTISSVYTAPDMKGSTTSTNNKQTLSSGGMFSTTALTQHISTPQAVHHTYNFHVMVTFIKDASALYISWSHDELDVSGYLVTWTNANKGVGRAELMNNESNMVIDDFDSSNEYQVCVEIFLVGTTQERLVQCRHSEAVKSASSGDPTAIIIGVVIAVIFFVLLLIVIIALKKICRRREKVLSLTPDYSQDIFITPNTSVSTISKC